MPNKCLIPLLQCGVLQSMSHNRVESIRFDYAWLCKRQDHHCCSRNHALVPFSRRVLRFYSSAFAEKMCLIGSNNIELFVLHANHDVTAIMRCPCCMTQVEMTTESTGILVYLKVISGREAASHVPLQVDGHSPLLL
jgi:hypothetical protein